MNSSNFNKLINGLQQDKYSIDEIYNFYFPRIVLHVKLEFKKFGTCFAEEVAHEFFLYLFKNRANLPVIEYPTSWVFQVCDNIARRELKRLHPDDESITDIEDDKAFSTEDIENYINNEELKDALRKLNDIERYIIFDKIWLGYSLIEISAKTNFNYNFVKQKYRRSLNKIKKFLKSVT